MAAPDIIDRINAALRNGKSLTLTITELGELADFVNGQVKYATECAAMLNRYSERQQGQASYQIH